MKKFVKYIFWLFFSSKGRIGVRTYNIGSLFLYIPIFLFIILLSVSSPLTNFLEKNTAFMIPGAVIYLLFFACGYRNIRAKRVHDFDRTDYVGQFTLQFSNGTKGPNQYGPDPLGKNK